MTQFFGEEERKRLKEAGGIEGELNGHMFSDEDIEKGVELFRKIGKREATGFFFVVAKENIDSKKMSAEGMASVAGMPRLSVLETVISTLSITQSEMIQVMSHMSEDKMQEIGKD